MTRTNARSTMSTAPWASTWRSSLETKASNTTSWWASVGSRWETETLRQQLFYVLVWRELQQKCPSGLPEHKFYIRDDSLTDKGDVNVHNSKVAKTRASYTGNERQAQTKKKKLKTRWKKCKNRCCHSLQKAKRTKPLVTKTFCQSKYITIVAKNFPKKIKILVKHLTLTKK